MRTLTANENAVAAAIGKGTRVRVSIRDASSTFRDLSTYPETDFVRGVEIAETIDDNGMTATVTLNRAIGDRSLAPLHDTSPLNRAFNPANSFAALIAVGREVKIEAGVTADGDSTPVVWNVVFQGYVDAIDWPDDELVLECVGLEAKLRDTWIERERVYAYAQGAYATKGCYPFDLGRPLASGDLVIPSQANLNGHFYRVTTAGTTSTTVEPTWPTGSGATVTSGTVTFTESGSTSTSTGTAVETVIQQILDDTLGASVVTLVTPTTPSWAIRYYLQKRDSVLEAIKALADQIGWFCRFAWNVSSSAFKLTFYEPGRAKTTPDYTFPASQIRKVERCRIEVTSIRNVVRVIYPDSANKDPNGFGIRTPLEVSDSSSITKYSRRFMEIAEGDNSNIDTAAEATALATAVLSDLKEPNAEYGVEVMFFPWLQLGDLLAFTADNIHFTADQHLAVTAYSHRFANGKASTQISTRGKPASGVGRWLEKDARGASEPTHQLTLASTGYQSVMFGTPTIGGAELSMSQAPSTGQSLQYHLETHISGSSGFTPSNLTMVSSGSSSGSKATLYTGLTPGKTYYLKTVPYTWNSEEHVRGLPSTETSFVAGRAKAGHYDAAYSQATMPFNGNFEHSIADLTTDPYDHWSPQAGSAWGSGSDIYFGTDAAYGGRTLILRGTANVGRIRSSVFPFRSNCQYFNLFVASKGSGSSAGSGTRRLVVTVYFWKDAAGASASSVLASAQFFYSTGPSGVWQPNKTAQSAFPSDANFVSIQLEKEAADANLTVELGYVNFVEAWIEQPNWSTPSFNTGWGDLGGAWETCAYMKDSLGFVHLRGHAIRSSGAATTIFTLPTGHRPSTDKMFAVDSNGAHGRIDILSSGAVVLSIGTPTAWASLNGITFDTR